VSYCPFQQPGGPLGGGGVHMASAAMPGQPGPIPQLTTLPQPVMNGGQNFPPQPG